MLNYRKVVQALFDEQSNNAVRVEDEVSTLGVFISDHTTAAVRSAEQLP